MLQRNGKTEAQGKEGKGVIVQVVFPVDLLLMTMASASAEERERLTGPLFHVLSQEGGTERRQN